MSEPHDIGTRWSQERLTVSSAEVDRIAHEVAVEAGLCPLKLRQPRVGGTRYWVARRRAWKRLAKPNVSIIDIARKWPCDHTSILHALGRTKRAKRRLEECNSSASPG